MHQGSPLHKGRIIVRLGILLTVEVLLVVISFGITTYIQSQSTDLGNTINIAGRNRFLTSNFLLQFDKVNHGTAQVHSLSIALDELIANIMVLKSGGELNPATGRVFLAPLQAKYHDQWNQINEKAVALGEHVRSMERTIAGGKVPADIKSANEIQLSSSSSVPVELLDGEAAAVETLASDLIVSSDHLTRQLGSDAQINSQNLVSMQTILLIGIVMVSGVVLYVIKRLLAPISLIIDTTKVVKKGNFAVPPVKHLQGSDEISILAASFNSMIEQLHQYDQMQKHFISIASHELRGPLQPILGLSDALRHSTENQAEARIFADTIFVNAKKLQNTTDNVLQATKMENQLLSLNKERLDIIGFVRSIVNDCNNQIKVSGKNIQSLLLFVKTMPDGRRFEVEESPDREIILNADKIRLNQVLTNLLTNAIHFTDKGTIFIIIEKQSDYKSSTRQNQVVISVKDTGCGISPEVYPRLFTKFGTMHNAGTGLGLYISRCIIEAHGGKIWAMNNPDGRGAAFTFTLPSADDVTWHGNPIHNNFNC